MSLLDRRSSAGELEDPKTPDLGLAVRAYKACAACRARKVRCIVEDRAAGANCVQCLKDGRDCVFEAKKRSYDTSTRARKAQEKRARLEAPEQTPPAENLCHDHFNVRSSADALLFLSEAAARHGDDAEQPREPVQQHSVVSVTSDNRGEGGVSGLADTEERARLESPASPCENADIQDTVATFHCRLFWEDIVTPNEALAYICFFFRDLYPFFPFIPDAYYTCLTGPNTDLQVMRSLFEEDDVLLGCLITVSSRYYHLPRHTVGGYERSCEVHNSSWVWTKRQVARVIFEGVRPKSPLSVVETLLMLAEWLPKPIHAFVENSNPQGRSTQGQRVGELILQPAFRTDQVSWSYVGNAFLLLRSLPPSRRLCPVLKTTSRYLTTLFGCLIMSQSLARRLGRPALMSFEDVDLTQVSQAFHDRNIRLHGPQNGTEAIPNLSLGISDQFHGAFVELMKLLAHTQDVLHPPTGDGIVEPKPDASQTNQRLLALLQHFDMMNQTWKTQYGSLWESSAPGMSEFSRAMLRIDFEYLRLYEFSMSLGTYLKLVGGGKDTASLSGRGSFEQQENDWEFPPTSLAYYIEQAIDAAELLLGLMLHFHSPMGKNTLRYASSRHYMKIVFASVFLIQVLRSGIPSMSYQTVLIATLKDTVAVLEGCSIDAAHPALRYSILLRGLMKDLEPSRLPESSSLIPLTIGQRQTQNTMPNEFTWNGSYPLDNAVNSPSNQEYRPLPFPAPGFANKTHSGTQTDFNNVPLPSAGVSRWLSSTGYAEGSQWTGFDSSIIEWEDSMAQLDTDTFLQSLMGVDVFPTM